MSAVEVIHEEGFVAILRSQNADDAVEAGTKLLLAGVRALEVSLVTPGALEAISALAASAPVNSVVGVGTALTSRDVEAAVSAGATFVVSPNTSRDVIEATRYHNAVSLPGAATPTEAVQAREWGADLVKIFPATLWSPGALRDMLAALPDLRLVPTGGVTVNSAGDWIMAGAFAVGVGSILSSATSPSTAAFELRAEIRSARASL